jgi:hypothetical protein
VPVDEPADATPDETPDKTKGAKRALYVVMPHETLYSVASMRDQLANEASLQGVEVNLTSSLLRPFAGAPTLERPATGADRRFQLRIYESPSVVTGQKKIEMFHNGELDIFEQVGLTANFFGECIAGPRQPNLTYLLSFESTADQRAAWGRFIADPAWKALSSKPEYLDDVLIRHITNIELKPLAASQL